MASHLMIACVASCTPPRPGLRALSRICGACVLALTLALASACKQDAQSDERTHTSTTAASEAMPATAPVAPKPAPSAAKPVLRQMLDWLDPDAVALAFMRLPPKLDVEKFCSVFALPPRAARLLTDVASIDVALGAVLGPSSAPVASWLGSEALAIQPVVASGTYVIRPLLGSRAEVEATFRNAGLVERKTDGFAFWLPQNNPLPWKMVFLSDTLLGFVGTREVGSGLGPFTAGRDLPASELETQIERELQAAPDTWIELFAQGPMLHFDLPEDVLAVRLRARPWNVEGADVEVVLQPTASSPAAVETLEARKLTFESDAVQALVDKVAFAREGEAITGRLQMTAEDLRVLHEP